jgi:DNA-binding beta-propeller fold protein YncE
LAVDHQDRIWITNGNSDTVARFPSADPGKAELFKVGLSPKGIAIDSAGNAWVNNFIGDPGLREKLELLAQKGIAFGKNLIDPKTSGADPQIALFHNLYDIAVANPGGDVTLLRPDGSEAPGSPFNGGASINAPWGIAVDGNDNVWIANGGGHSVTELCGVRVETCPPGHRTGDPISPPQTGYRGHGLQILTDVAIDQAGNVWVANNWDLAQQGFLQDPDPALSTRFGGNGFVVFFGLAKPVVAPLVGPPRTP